MRALAQTSMERKMRALSGSDMISKACEIHPSIQAPPLDPLKLYQWEDHLRERQESEFGETLFDHSGRSIPRQ